jgi:hypothetical protein
MAANKLNYIEADGRSVILGSGQLYAIQNTGSLDYSTITTESMTDLGFIQANAELKASAERKDIETANGGTVASVQGKKTVEFVTGIMDWNLSNVSSFLTGSSVVEDVATGKKTLYYGDADKSPNVMLRFVSEDETAKKRITIDIFKCSFMGELGFIFGEDPITFDYAFKVLSTTMPNNKMGYFSVTEEDIV